MDGHQEIVAAIEQLNTDLNDRHAENVTQQRVTDQKVDEAIRRIDDLHKAFPDGDWDGHRRYHEAIIRKAEDRAQFYRELRGELAKKGLWAVAGVLGLALWAWFKARINS